MTPARFIGGGSTLLPRLAVAPIGAVAKGLTGAAIRRATSEGLAAAEFPLRPLAVARRPARGGTIAARPVFPLAKTFPLAFAKTLAAWR